MFDHEINSLLDALPEPSVIDVMGEAGTGKTLLASGLIARALERSQPGVVFFLNGVNQARQFLFQTLSVGIDFFPYLHAGLLQVRTCSAGLAQVHATIPSLPAAERSFIAIDGIGPSRVAALGTAFLMGHALKADGRSTILIASGTRNGGGPGPSDLSFFLTRSGVAVERGDADASLVVHGSGQALERSLVVHPDRVALTKE